MTTYLQDLKRYVPLNNLEKYALLMLNSNQKSRVTMKTRDQLRSKKLIDKNDKPTSLGMASLTQALKKDSKDGNGR